MIPGKPMTRPLVLFAHPVASNTFGTYDDNMKRAREWYRLAVLRGEQLEVDVVAPWIADVTSFDDTIQAERAMGIARSTRFLRRCGFVWTFGAVISSGMLGECETILRRRGRVLDYTHHRFIRPPTDTDILERILDNPLSLGTTADLRELVAVQCKATP